MLAYYERLVEVVLIEVKADRSGVCSGFNALVPYILRNDAVRQSLEPHVFDASVIIHVLFFCPAHAGYIYVCPSDIKLHCIRDSFTHAVCCVEPHKISVARYRQDGIMIDRAPGALFARLAYLEITCHLRIVDRNYLRQFKRDGLSE